jgi:autotransporter-associated beta strand protein
VVGSVGARARGGCLRAHESQPVLAAPHPAPAVPALFCKGQKRTAASAALLGSSALSAAALAMLLAGPQAALANCDVLGSATTPVPSVTNSVSCAANTTTVVGTNTDGATASSNAAIQAFTANGAVSAGISAGVTVGGQGLTILQNVVNGALTFTNDGTAASLAGTSVPGLHLITFGGLITYSGNGNVTAGFGLNDGLKAEANGGSISINTGTGTITTAGGDRGGLSAVTNGAGTISVTTNGTIAANGQQGIYTSAADGLTTINVNGGSVTRIRAISSGAGGVQINVNAGSVALSGQPQIFIDSASTGTIDVSIAAGATVGGVGSSDGLSIAGGGTGATNITVLGTLSSNGTAADFRGTLTVGNGGTSGTLVGGVSMQDSATLLRFNRSDAVSFGGVISGAGALEKLGAGTLTLLDTNTHTGGTTISAGTLQIGNGGGSGSLLGNITNNAALIVNSNNMPGLGGVISGSGTLEKLASGTLTLSGVNTYIGATTVNAGTLAVTGSTASSALTTVNAGGTLMGTGTVGNTTVAGGVFAPGSGAAGTTQTVNGTLGFSAGGIYRVFVNPAAASSANITGTATLTGGTVNAQFAAGSYLTRSYTILTAGTRTGTFTGLTTGNLPSGFTASLDYGTANAVTLGLTALLPSNLPSNQQGAANAIANYFNNGGVLPPGFVTLLGLTGQAQQNGLSQVSGEGGHGATQTASYTATNQFMGAMFDPSIDGRGGSGGPSNYAEDDHDSDELAYAGKRKRSKAERDALKAVTPRDRRYDAFTPRFSVWAAGYGGSASVDGNASSGTHSTASRIYGTAVGADIRIGIDTVVGLAMGGGGTSFNTADGLGSGSADLFQVGVHGRRHFGAAYVAGALAYGWQDVTTDRTVTVAGTDRLRANFNAHTFAARGETGYRFGHVVMGVPFGVTPYAALQVTTFSLPGYSETAVSGSNQFALAFSSQSETNVRTELGVRADKSFAMRDGVMTLRGRAAWAHDSNTDRAVSPTFQSLPGSSSFTVNGAKPSADGALLSAGTEMKWRNGWSVAGLFEGEFSGTTESYSGKGSVRRAW